MLAVRKIHNLKKIYNSSNLLFINLQDKKSVSYIEIYYELRKCCELKKFTKYVDTEKYYHVFHDELNYVNYTINFEENITNLLCLIDRYKTIDYDKYNIEYYIELSSYFMLSNDIEFQEYVVEKFIFEKNIFYNELCKYNLICSIIENKIGKKNNITNETFKYINNINNLNNSDMFKNITKLYSTCIEQDVLNTFENLEILDINSNKNIYDLNKFEKLKELNISNFCSVRQSGINNLKNIEILHMANNGYIKNFNNLNNIKKIYVSVFCNTKNMEIIPNIEIIKDFVFEEFDNLMNLDCDNNSVDNNSVDDNGDNDNHFNKKMKIAE